MKILVAHDRQEVAAQIGDIAKCSGVPNIIVEYSSDGTTSRRLLSKSVFDLAIFDLTLPHIHGVDNPSYTTVDQLLQELFLLEDLNVPGDIIGLTREPEALERVKNTFGTHVMAIIPEDREAKWKEQLLAKIQYVARASKSRQNSINQHHDYDCIIVTALDEELAPFHQIFEFSEYPRFPGSFNFAFSDHSGTVRRGIGFSIGKSGEARAASFTQSLITTFRPKLILMSGICGGVRGKTDLGDLVIADSAIDWDYGKWAEPEEVTDDKAGTGASDEASAARPAPVFLSRPSPVSISETRAHRIARNLLASDFLSDPKLLREISKASEGRIKAPKAHLAPMASGSAVIASDEVLKRIRNLNDSIRGIDMECFGFYHAATTTHVVKPEVLCIKSVSDYSNGTKGDEHHAGCSFASASAIAHILKSLWQF